ncbi:MAG: murein biosynthesis integral membrane protein MurJ [Gammaproteobacteria bacterium]|nr:MAG: murein biosynthesis integral membrane protein MurJ [Gammaproteobacteria bacterium]
MSKLLKSSGVFALMTLLSRVLGLVRDVVIAKYFSVEQTDVFFTALRIPNTLRRFFAEGGFANAFVPVLNETKENRSQQALQSLINHVFGVLGTILLIITLLGMVFAGYVIAVIGFGFAETPDRLALGTTMLRITFPYILFISLTAFFAGILNTYQRFALPAFAPALLNVALITGALWFRDDFDPPALVLAWAVFIGGLSQFLLQIPTLWRLKRLPRPKVSFAHKGVRKILKLMLPTLLGSSVGQINILLNTALASSLVTGSITWLYYSDRLVEMPVALIGVALGVVILPRLSALKAQADNSQFRQTLLWAFRIAFLTGTAAATGLMVLALPLMMTILARGEFSPYSAQMAAKSLTVYGFGALALVLVKVLAPGFYSRHNTRTPATIAIVCVGVNIVFALLLYRPLGHVGLATSATIAGFVNCSTLLFFLHRDGCIAFDRRVWLFIARVLLANVVMAVVLTVCNRYITVDTGWEDFTQLKRIAVLAVLILVGIVSYFAALLLLRVNIRSLVRPMSVVEK